jgi:hypothetical protein
MRRLAVALTAAALCAGATAQTTPRKPGLWEVQTQHSGSAMPDMAKMLADMPPAQRAQMEKMMKERGVAAGGAPSSMRYCLSPEKAAQEPMAQADPDTKCEHKTGSRAGGETRFSFTCTGKDGTKMQGEGRTFDTTPEKYAMEMTTRTSQGGQPMEMRMSQRGKWLGADCKGLKPL